MTNYFTTPNIITQEDEILDYDCNFKNNFKLKPYQKATIKKMVEHEGKFFINTQFPQKYEEVVSDEVRYGSNSLDSDDIVYNNYDRIDNNTTRFNLHTNIGVLSNEVGSGKTAVVMGLIKYKPLMKNKYDYSNFMKKLIYDNMLSFPKDLTNIIAEYDNPNINCQLITHLDKELEHNNVLKIPEMWNKYIKTNLIIVPHNLFLQWKGELANITDFSVKHITTKKDFKDLEEETIQETLSNYDIVLCNANKLKDLNKLTSECVWSRIFIDEVDTINIPAFPYLQSYFLWFVSTTYERILKPKNKGFINDLFSPEYSWRDDCKEFYKFVLNSITYTCDKDYINKYLQLQKPDYNYIQYPTPFVNKILYNLNIKTINKFINSNDFKAIIEYFGKTEHNLHNFVSDYFYNNRDFINNDQTYRYYLTRVDSHAVLYSEYPKQIVIILSLIYLMNKIDSVKRSINNKIREYKQYVRQVQYMEVENNSEDSEDSDFGLLNRYECKKTMKGIQNNCLNTIKRYYELVKKLKYIKCQFTNNNICFFCHEISDCYDHRNICCHGCLNNDPTLQIFKNCFTFFNECKLYRGEIAKFLRSYKIMEDTKVSPFITNDEHNRTTIDFKKLFNYTNINNINNIKNRFSYDVKINKIITLINRDNADGKRVLIFSDNINFFNSMKTKLEENAVSFKVLKGNGNVIRSILRKYTKGDIGVLLLNTRFMGSGLNLQMSDKIYIMSYLDKNTETQVVGRANRYGREGTLQVNYIFYEDEVELYENENIETTDDEEIEEI